MDTVDFGSGFLTVGALDSAGFTAVLLLLFGAAASGAFSETAAEGAAEGCGAGALSAGSTESAEGDAARPGVGMAGAAAFDEIDASFRSSESEVSLDDGFEKINSAPTAPNASAQNTAKPSHRLDSAGLGSVGWLI